MKFTIIASFIFIPLFSFFSDNTGNKNNDGYTEECQNILQVDTEKNIDVAGISEKYCSSAFDGNVKTYQLNNAHSKVGHSIWISRKSGKAKAKYFAHKQDGHDVHHRYTMWRVKDNKQVVLKSSGAYATGWNSSDVPVGVTVDNGIVVNKQYDNSMDGLVIVYATGGIAVSNIEDKDLRLESIDEEVDITDMYDRTKFINWAVSEDATVFQTHLMIYKNNIKVGQYNSSSRRAKRKFLALAKSSSGELFHIILYLKDKEYTLYDATAQVYNYLIDSKKMDVIAMVNLDTGGYDILNTGGDATDCRGNNVWGTSDTYEDMTNLLSYEFDE